MNRFAIILTILIQAAIGISQCPEDNTYYTTVAPSCPDDLTLSCVFGGEYILVEITAGNEYTFSTCGSTSFDTQLTLLDQSGAALDYNDDACGLQSSITWVASYTGMAQLLLDEFYCSNGAGCIDLNIECSAGDSIDPCPNDNTLYDEVTPQCPGVTTLICMNGGQYALVNVAQGYNYIFSTCFSPVFDSQLSLFDAFGNAIAFNDDGCGSQSTISWTASYTGQVQILVDAFDCADNTTCIDLSIECYPTTGNGDGCNTDIQLCQNVGGPFFFQNPGPAVSSCLDWFSNSNFAYIMVNITTSGPLSLLIDGNGTTGFLDVSVFNIPNGVNACEAIQDIDNEIGCNYASQWSGCNQFGNNFPCPSIVPSPYVLAGQTIMIVVEDWQDGESDQFMLYLGPPPNAQSGPANPQITSVGPFCQNAPTLQLIANDAGGQWLGPGTSLDGVFNPALAGLGTHTINYSIGLPPCQAQSSTSIEVVTTPNVSISASDDSICPGELVILTATGGPNYIWSTGATDSSIQVSPNVDANYTVTVELPGGCSDSASASISVGQPIITSPLYHD